MAKILSPSEQSGFDSAKLYLWVRGLESKVNNLLREVDVIKNDFIKKNQNMKQEQKMMSEDMLELKHQLVSTSRKLDLMVKELRKTAGIEEVMTLKKYLDLWNPMNFVTQRELEREIESKISVKNSKNNKNPSVIHPDGDRT